MNARSNFLFRISFWTTSGLLILALTAIPAVAASGCPDISPVSPPSRYTLNIQDFGAVGDGIADDRPAIQDALNCAQQLRYANVVFPAKVYRLISSTDITSQLHLTSWYYIYSVQLSGTGTVFVSERTGSGMLTFEGYWTDGIVQGITFRNTHALTTDRVQGLEIGGGGENAAVRGVVRNCTFENFSRGLVTSGVTGLLIQNNRFLLDRGRDSGTSINMLEPNVGIWMFNNYPNGTSIDVEITGNLYDGCVSGSLMGHASPYCGDGLVFGRANHAYVHNNHVQRFSFEAIFLLSNQGPGGSGSLPSIIENNTIDATTVTGDRNGGGMWGIRSDDDGVTVVGNTINNAIYGICVSSTDLVLHVKHTVVKKNNLFLSSAANPAIGIVLSTADYAVVDSNTIILPQALETSGPETMAMYVSGPSLWSVAVAPTITNNMIIAYGGKSSGRTTGIFMQWADQWNIAHNTIQGFSQIFHFMNFGPSPPDINPLLQLNSVSGNISNSLRTN